MPKVATHQSAKIHSERLYYKYKVKVQQKNVVNVSKTVVSKFLDFTVTACLVFKRSIIPTKDVHSTTIQLKKKFKE